MVLKKNFNENNLSFNEICNALKFHWKIIVFTPIFFAMTASVASFFLLTPKYKVQVTFYIEDLYNESKFEGNYLNSPQFINQIFDNSILKSEKSFDKESLTSISFKQIKSSNLYFLNFETTKPELSKSIVDAVFTNLSDYHQKLTNVYISNLEIKINILKNKIHTRIKNYDFKSDAPPQNKNESLKVLSSLEDFIELNELKRMTEKLGELNELKTVLVLKASNNSQIFDTIKISERPDSPHFPSIFLFSFFFGLFGALFFVFFSEIFLRQRS